jgi:hypothetical protein
MRLAQRVPPAIGRISFILELELVIFTDFAKGVVLVGIELPTVAAAAVIGSCCVGHKVSSSYS